MRSHSSDRINTNILMSFSEKTNQNSSCIIDHEGDVRKCGGIITNPELDSVIVVMNRHSAWKGENKWGLPKGHARPGETPPECAQREIQEETGLYFSTQRFRRHIYLNGNHYYLIILKTPYNNFQTNDEKEISDVRWMPISELRNLNYNSDIKRFLKIFPNNRIDFTRCHRNMTNGTNQSSYNIRSTHHPSNDNIYSHYHQHLTAKVR